MVLSRLTRTLHDQRHRAVIDQFDLHHGAENPRLNG